MPADPRIAALPAVRALAEERAREAHSLFARFTWGVDDGWSELDDDAQATLVRVHLALLSDLSRPASRDEIARLVAAKVGIECGATAPDLQRVSFYAEGERSHSWLLGVLGRRWSFHSENEDPDGAAGWALVPGVSDITDPAAALTLIALAVLGGPDAR